MSIYCDPIVAARGFARNISQHQWRALLQRVRGAPYRRGAAEPRGSDAPPARRAQLAPPAARPHHTHHMRRLLIILQLCLSHSLASHAPYFECRYANTELIHIKYIRHLLKYKLVMLVKMRLTIIKIFD